MSIMTAEMSFFVSGWWMKRGFTGPKISTKRSTGMSYCAVSGLWGANASSTISRANSESACSDGRGL